MPKCMKTAIWIKKGFDMVQLSNPIRFAVVGLGRIGLRHAEQVAKTNGFELSAICEPLDELREQGRNRTVLCKTCHGADGMAVQPNTPNLAGQNEQYIANQVTDILSGKRKNKLTLLMTENPVVKKITVEEIAGIASYMKNIK